MLCQLGGEGRQVKSRLEHERADFSARCELTVRLVNLAFHHVVNTPLVMMTNKKTQRTSLLTVSGIDNKRPALAPLLALLLPNPD